MKKERSIMILFPGLTHAGKLYDYGEIEKNPDSFLLEAATEKTMMFHRDSNKNLRICKFVNLDKKVPETDVEIDDDGEVIDDLTEMMRPELLTLASSLGLQKKKAVDLDKDQLKRIVRFLRRL